MPTIQISGSLRPKNVNTPVEDGSVIATLSDIENIVLPYVGKQVYCLADRKHYVVTSLNQDGDMVTGYEECADEKEVSILFVGNSLLQDAVAYLPLLLREQGVRYRLYMWYCGGYTLARNYERFVNNEVADIFSVCENATSWTNFSSTGGKTMSSILQTYQFDIVCLQEYWNYAAYDNGIGFNNCVAYIRQHYPHPFKAVSFFHAPHRTGRYNNVDFNVDTLFETIRGNMARLVDDTGVSDFIPAGVALYGGLKSSLSSLGDGWTDQNGVSHPGQLTPDGTHAQEGIPCLLQAYSTAEWVFREYGLNISILNSALRITQQVYNTLNVPGANLGSGLVIGVEDDITVAQRIAVWSLAFALVPAGGGQATEYVAGEGIFINNRVVSADPNFVFTDESKRALNNLLALLAPTVSGGSDALAAYIQSLNLDVEVVRITASLVDDSIPYQQGQDINTLRANLRVEATLSDTTTRVVTDYALSGSIVDGTTTITVSYRGQTDSVQFRGYLYVLNPDEFLIGGTKARYPYYDGTMTTRYISPTHRCAVSPNATYYFHHILTNPALSPKACFAPFWVDTVGKAAADNNQDYRWNDCVTADSYRLLSDGVDGDLSFTVPATCGSQNRSTACVRLNLVPDMDDFSANVPATFRIEYLLISSSPIGNLS